MKKSFYLDDSRHSIDWAPQSIDWDLIAHLLDRELLNFCTGELLNDRC
eukprot:COSAG02_NODE_3956_length_5986_cov_18.502633_3_plen_48_part_00